MLDLNAMTSASPPPTPNPAPQAKKKRSGFMCFNIKFAHAIKKQPIALATMFASSLLAVASGSMVWYVTAFANAPWNIKQLDDHLTAVEKNVDVRFQRIETTVQGEIEKDNRDRELLRAVYWQAGHNRKPAKNHRSKVRSSFPPQYPTASSGESAETGNRFLCDQSQVASGNWLGWWVDLDFAEHQQFML